MSQNNFEKWSFLLFFLFLVSNNLHCSGHLGQGLANTTKEQLPKTRQKTGKLKRFSKDKLAATIRSNKLLPHLGTVFATLAVCVIYSKFTNRRGNPLTNQEKQVPDQETQTSVDLSHQEKKPDKITNFTVKVIFPKKSKHSSISVKRRTQFHLHLSNKHEKKPSTTINNHYNSFHSAPVCPSSYHIGTPLTRTPRSDRGAVPPLDLGEDLTSSRGSLANYSSFIRGQGFTSQRAPLLFDKSPLRRSNSLPILLPRLFVKPENLSAFAKSGDSSLLFEEMKNVQKNEPLFENVGDELKTPPLPPKSLHESPSSPKTGSDGD